MLFMLASFSPLSVDYNYHNIQNVAAQLLTVAFLLLWLHWLPIQYGIDYKNYTFYFYIVN